MRIGGDVVPKARDGSVEGVRSVLHVKLFHPTNDHYGLSPLEAAASAIDLHNTASKWNKALLDNSARPSGAIVYTARDGNLTGDQIDRLKSELEAGFQGSANAGRPLLLEGGLDWKAMSLSPKDMDFLEARHAAAREIALALGVPPMLLGIPGDNTYSNLAEAQRTFWRTTVLPLVDRVASELSHWLAPGFARNAGRTHAPDAQWASEGANVRLVPDLDTLPALAGEREALWASLEKTSFLTTDEKRALAGFSPAPAEQKFNPNQPRIPAGNRTGGQWANGDGEDDGDFGRTPDGTRVDPAARRPRGGRFPRDHNNPPQPLPPVLPPGAAVPEDNRIFDEAGALAPRGFADVAALNAFKDRLAEELPRDVSAVMQGSAVERGGSRFRAGPQGDIPASDFDVSLTGGDLFETAALRQPRMLKGNRVGPLTEDELLDVGIDLRGLSGAFGRDTKFMIYRNQIELYRRGPGYPLVAR